MASLLDILAAKPVLIGLHLGFGIIGIDAFLWVIGELMATGRNGRRSRIAAVMGVVGFALSWIAGGFYYVRYYGTLVKPAIKAGYAPWAHTVIMESKEHIFLFILPLAMTVLFLLLLDAEEFERGKFRSVALKLSGLTAFLGLLIGAMGFIVSAAARWG